jgi:hypothetical protein
VFQWLDVFYKEVFNGLDAYLPKNRSNVLRVEVRRKECLGK